MTRFAIALGAAALVLFCPGTARARAPSNLPTLEDVLARAREIEAKKAAGREDATRDRLQEAIDEYRTKKTALDEWQKLAELIKDDKTKENFKYRGAAAKALLERFAAEDSKDPRVRKVRIAIGLELCDLLRAPAEDADALAIANDIFGTWWRSEFIQSKWVIGAKQRDRKTACDKIRKFLKASDKD